jgi:hypothetical protein
MTAYVQQVIGVLRGVQSEIGAVLQAESEQSIKINSAIYQEIDSLDEVIQKLKSTSEKITQRDNFEPPAGLSAAKAGFVTKIVDWRKKKIKMTSEDEARKVAAEFEKDSRLFFKEFTSQVEAAFHAAINDIGSKFFSDYYSAGFGDMYKSNQEFHINLSGYALPDFVSGFLELKSEQYVEQSETPFGRLKNMKNMWANAPSDDKEPVRVVTYLYQEWREKAETLASPVLDGVIQSVNETLKDFNERVAQDYLGHLKALIEQQTQKKDEVSAQLSGDERKLQADNDWFTVFQEKLHEIERG